VSLQEYMAFMISKETENVQSSEEIENAFRAITAGDRPYVTKEELYAVSQLLNLYYSDQLSKNRFPILGRVASNSLSKDSALALSHIYYGHPNFYFYTYRLNI
jgi:Ca2+ insensitive EF hand